MQENIIGNALGVLQVRRGAEAVAAGGGRLPAVRGHFAGRRRPSKNHMEVLLSTTIGAPHGYDFR